jgi:hypothetical protein
MRKDNAERFSAITKAKMPSTSGTRLHLIRQKRRLAQLGELKLLHLMTWESEIFIHETHGSMKYCVFKQPKQQKTNKSAIYLDSIQTEASSLIASCANSICTLFWSVKQIDFQRRRRKPRVSTQQADVRSAPMRTSSQVK